MPEGGGRGGIPLIPTVNGILGLGGANLVPGERGKPFPRNGGNILPGGGGNLTPGGCGNLIPEVTGNLLPGGGGIRGICSLGVISPFLM